MTGLGILHFGGCKLLAPLGEKCSIPASIETKTLSGTVLNEMPIKAGVVKAAEGEVIVELPFTGEKCPATVKGKQPIRGEDLCIATEAEVDLRVHTGECTAEGSNLKLGANLATFEAKAEVEWSGLSKELKWDVALG